MSLSKIAARIRARQFADRQRHPCAECGTLCDRRAARCLQCARKHTACVDCDSPCWRGYKRCRACYLVWKKAGGVKRRRQWRKWAMTGTCATCGGPCHRQAVRCIRCFRGQQASRLCLDCGQRAVRYASGLCKPCHEHWKMEITFAYREPGSRITSGKMEP